MICTHIDTDIYRHLSQTAYVSDQCLSRAAYDRLSLSAQDPQNATRTTKNLTTIMIEPLQRNSKER